MKSYAQTIEETINQLEYNELIIASSFHHQYLSEIPEPVFYKTLERMTKVNKLTHITKGVYARPFNTELGLITVCNQDVFRYFLNDNHGVMIGYGLYNHKLITTQVPFRYQILSNRLLENKKHIQNVEVIRIPFELTTGRIEAIETLEILQNINHIEDINYRLLKTYMSNYAKKYSEEDVEFVLTYRKYKKSTIALLKQFLNYYGVENHLNKYLSAMSDYKIISMEEINEFASEPVVF